MEEKKIAQIAKALASTVRVRILRILEEGERCGCELVPLLNLCLLYTSPSPRD